MSPFVSSVSLSYFAFPSRPFGSIIGFSNLELQPTIANTFLVELCETRYTKLNPHLIHSLQLAEKIGMHSDILEFKNGVISQYVLSHPTNRPFGFPTLIQCHQCGTVRGQRRTSEIPSADQRKASNIPQASVYVSVCACGAERRTNCPDDLVMVKQTASTGDGTSWFWQPDIPLARFLRDQTRPRQWQTTLTGSVASASEMSVDALEQ